MLWEKEVMTWCVFGVIFGSIIYYGVVFISEVFGYTPKCIQRMCSNQKMHHDRKEKKDQGLGDLKMHDMTANPMSERQLKIMQRDKDEVDKKAKMMELANSHHVTEKSDLMLHYKNMKARQSSMRRAGSAAAAKPTSGAGLGFLDKVRAQVEVEAKEERRLTVGAQVTNVDDML